MNPQILSKKISLITLKPWVLNIEDILKRNIYILELIGKRSIIFCIPEHAKVLCAV